MKRVTLYTINAEEKMVCDPGEKIEWYLLDAPPVFLPVVDSDPKEIMVTTMQADIRRVIKRGEEIYVAIEPELEKILMAPRTGYYEGKIYQLSSRLESAVAKSDGFEAAIAKYNSLPWWKKIFTKIS